MSAWIKSYQALRQHPKTRKLARRLGVRLPEAVGILHCLWWWCIDYAPDGDLTKHDAEDIALACEWEGEPKDIIEHLTSCGFIDNGDGLRLHDWDEYGGALVVAREKEAERKREGRSSASSGRPADVQRTRGNVRGSPNVDREDRKRRKKDLTENRPVDNSTVRPVSAQKRKDTSPVPPAVSYCPEDGATIQADGHCPVCQGVTA